MANPHGAILAAILVEECIRQGVSHFCIAPGSRSTPLTLAAATHPEAITQTHFDERGLGFYALGLAKGLKAPVAIITTSGTAVANLLPAVIEAYYAQVPLLILTADRPQELRDIQSNQTIIQENIFKPYVAYAQTIEAPHDEFAYDWFCSTVSYASFMAKSKAQPIHLNLAFREPFSAAVKLSEYDHLPRVGVLSKWLSTQQPFTQHERPVAFDLDLHSLQHKKGILLVGELSSKADILSVAELLAHLKWPCWADCMAGLKGADLKTVSQFETVLKDADLVLQLGGRLVNKAVIDLIKEQKTTHILVSPTEFRQDPTLSVSQHYHVPVDLACQAIVKQVSTNSWTTLPAPLNPESREKTLISWLSKEVTKQDCLFMAGNSLSVRWVDALWDADCQVFANRGASGIDGLIATAIGLTEAKQKPGVLLLGDLSFLYDLNSLALLSQTSQPLTCVVVNNDGGGIFENLPIRQNKEHYKTFFQTPHGFTFDNIAKQFNLSYQQSKVGTLSEIHLDFKKSTCIELSF